MAELVILLSCEHGGHEVPPEFGHLFVGQECTLASHRGWDPGALCLAEGLSALLGVPLVATTISRLMVDTNRSPGHRALFSEFSRPLPDADKAKLLEGYYLPHRQRVQDAVCHAIEQGKLQLHLAIHSFTPVLDGMERKADLGLLYDSGRPVERQFCREWQARLGQDCPELRARRNYPYRGASDGLATWLRQCYPESQYLGIEVEVNQLRLRNNSDCAAMATLLARTLMNMLPVLGQLPPAPSGSQAELVTIVDQENRVVGQATRQEMRRQNLAHRATYIMVFNRRGELFVQKRTLTKDIYPGYYDIAAGGVVQAGESYDESAQRELQEELGITATLECLGDRYFEDERNKVWGRIYRCCHEGPFMLQESEVESGTFMAPEAILAGTSAKFTPDGLAILARIAADKELNDSLSIPHGNDEQRQDDADEKHSNLDID